MEGPVERRLKEEIRRWGTICLSLIDSEGITLKKAAQIAEGAEMCGSSAILVGGSTAIDQLELDRVVRAVKRGVKIPIILFPGNVTGVSPNADAILFTSLLNSDNPYFITEAQALGALAVKKYGLEAIPSGYIIIGEGGATGFVGRARGIPTSNPELAAMYALAAQYMGMRFVYLEAGSGVTSQVPVEAVSFVRKVYDGVLIVGGGIRYGTDAKRLASAGADALVVGTILEEAPLKSGLREIVEAVRKV